MNLYEINHEIMSCIDEETGEILNEERLAELQMAEEEKIENIACWIKNLNADVEALKNEKKVFEERIRVNENKAESLKKYLKGYLNGNKFETSKVRISYRKSKSLEIDNPENIPFDYITYEPKYNKTDLKKAIEDGLQVEGVRIIEKQNIQIK